MSFSSNEGLLHGGVSCVANAATFRLSIPSTTDSEHDVSYGWKSFGWVPRVCVGAPLVTLLVYCAFFDC